MTLTAEQKLMAIEFKYYQGQKWEPSKGDFYTLTRHSMGLELWEIVDKTDESITICKVFDSSQGEGLIPGQEEKWDLKEFTDEDSFMKCRVHVPKWILEL